MFFFLSKLLGFLISPINWILFLLVFAVIIKKPKRKQKLVVSAFFLMFLFTNPFFSNRVFRAYEVPEVEMNALRDTFDIGIVLSGFTNSDLYTNADRLNFALGVNRITDAVVLYKRGIIKKILISGGESNVIKNKKLEADETKKFLLQIGVKDEDVIAESKSRNTYENAKFTKILLDSLYPNARCMLITSAFHIPRAKRCFEKVGLKTFPFPAHFLAEKITASPESYIIPDAGSFKKWKEIMKEWVGVFVYKIMGYI